MKYALVTGGSRGIGRAVCVKLAQMGYHIIINYVSNATEAQKTLELVRQAGQDGEILMFDVSNRQQTSKAIESWENAHPEEYIEVLVNNAGIRRDNLLIFMPENDWHRVLSISLDGFYNVTQPLLQSMLARKFGRVINMASVSGVKGMPGQTSKGSHHSRHESTGSGGSTQKCDCQRCRPRIYQNRYGRGTRRRYTEENHSSQPLRYSRGSGRTGWLSGFAKRRLHYR